MKISEICRINCQFYLTCRERAKKRYCARARDTIKEAKQEKAEQARKKARELEIEEYLESDLFDKESVGKDITTREFYEREEECWKDT